MTAPDAKDATAHPPVSPWAAPRPDGPLAEALRRAAVGRTATGAPSPATLHRELPVEPSFVVPGPAVESMPPVAALDEELAALAREAAQKGEQRDAVMLSLIWPEDALRESESPDAAAATGGMPAAKRMLLVAAVAVAVAMGAAIFLRGSADAPQPKPGQPASDSALKLDYRMGPDARD